MTANKHLIHIYGHNSLQNELLSRYLEIENGLTCTHSVGIANAKINKFLIKRPNLILIDCLGLDRSQIWYLLEIDTDLNQYQIPIVLFNIIRDNKVEDEALKLSVRGVIYDDDQLDMFINGVKAVLKGEVWYPGQTLANFIGRQRNIAVLTKDTISSLTSRENQVLKKIASGACNKEIATDLGISIHTVKSHVTKIFKKIKVKNRLRAAQFAARHCSSLRIVHTEMREFVQGQGRRKL